MGQPPTNFVIIVILARLIAEPNTKIFHSLLINSFCLMWFGWVDHQLILIADIIALLTWSKIDC